MRCTDICLYLAPADRAELQALLSNRNTPRKLTWRTGIVLATADGQGTVEIMRRTGMSKPTVWRWQERYLDEGVPVNMSGQDAALARAAPAQGSPTEQAADSMAEAPSAIGVSEASTPCPDSL
jgi:hypothetical protein